MPNWESWEWDLVNEARAEAESLRRECEAETAEEAVLKMATEAAVEIVTDRCDKPVEVFLPGLFSGPAEGRMDRARERAPGAADAFLSALFGQEPPSGNATAAAGELFLFLAEEGYLDAAKAAIKKEATRFAFCLDNDDLEAIGATELAREWLSEGDYGYDD